MLAGQRVRSIALFSRSLGWTRSAAALGPAQPRRGHFRFPKHAFRGTAAEKYLREDPRKSMERAFSPEVTEALSPQAVHRLQNDSRHQQIRELIERSDRELGVRLDKVDPMNDPAGEIENMDPQVYERFMTASVDSLSHIPDGYYASEIEGIMDKDLMGMADEIKNQSLNPSAPGWEVVTGEDEGQQPSSRDRPRGATAAAAATSADTAAADAKSGSFMRPDARAMRAQARTQAAAEQAAQLPSSVPPSSFPLFGRRPGRAAGNLDRVPERRADQDPARRQLSPEAVQQLVNAAASPRPPSQGSSQTEEASSRAATMRDRIRQAAASDPDSTTIELDLRDNFRLSQSLQKLEDEIRRRRGDGPPQSSSSSSSSSFAADSLGEPPGSAGIAAPQQAQQDPPGPDVVDLLPFGTPSLFSESRRVPEANLTDPKFKQHIRELLATKDHHRAMGLAGPQIGWNARVISFGFNPVELEEEYQLDALPVEIKEALLSCKFQVWVNPEIVEVSKKKLWFWESCLSVPGLYGWIERPGKVRVRGFDHYGRPKEELMSGLTARIFQHERDHLDGVLFTQRVISPRYIISEQMQQGGTEHWDESCLPAGARSTPPGLLSEVE